MSFRPTLNTTRLHEPPGHPQQNSPYSVANWDTETIYTSWLSFRDSVNWDVALQLFDYDLQTIGEVQYLNIREGTYNCNPPRLAISSNGVGAAWIEEREPNRILFRSLDAAGNPISQPVRVEDNYEDFTRDSLNIAALESGYILVWYDERDSSSIWGQIVDFDGNLINGNFQIRADSTGSILGLECQNHPDGRVLVSWVADQQYSRGRWLDADGVFMGGVFEMIEEGAISGLAKSLVRFESEGSGILYQYEGGYWWGDIYLTYLDSIGIQTGVPIWLGEWAGSMGPEEMHNRFPDIICLPDSDYVYTLLNHYVGWGIHYYSNTIHSTVAGLSITLSEIVEWGNYNLCQLNADLFLYTFSIGQIGLRKYEISTLDSCEQMVWINEPDFGVAQNRPGHIVHQNGYFRVIYNNFLNDGLALYTRNFNSSGIPASPDTIASIGDPPFIPSSSGGRIKTTSVDQALIIWSNGSIRGTLFTQDGWCGETYDYGCASGWLIPNFDINNYDYVMNIWTHVVLGGPWGDDAQVFCQSFAQLFNYYLPEIAISPEWWGNWTYSNDVGLRDDGRFLSCYIEDPYCPFLYVLPGINYNELVGDRILIAEWISGAPSLEKSENGYWLTWIGLDSLRLQQFDADANLIGEPDVISSDQALPTGDPDLAVSTTGNFTVVWQDARDDEGDIYYRKFNSDGSFFGEEFKVNNDPPGVLQSEPAVAFGPNDQLYFTWTDFRNAGGQGDIYCKVVTWEDSVAPPDPPQPPPVPYVFELKPPAPNPFNTGTRISYSIPSAGQVSLTVHNLLGSRPGESHSECGKLRNHFRWCGSFFRCLYPASAGRK
jgi:hypothetical protein